MRVVVHGHIHSCLSLRSVLFSVTLIYLTHVLYCRAWYFFKSEKIMQKNAENSLEEKKPLLTSDAWYNIIFDSRIQRFIVVLILLNTISLGLETSESVMKFCGGFLYAFDTFALCVYTIEITLKIIALRMRFFRDGWNVFDFLIVAIAYVPAVGTLSVLRSLRILRAMRIISVIPRLRVIVRSLITSLPSIGWISLLLMVMFYIFAVMSTRLFGATFPEWFGSLGDSYYTLFQILTLESWSMGIVRPVMEQFPYAWIFFIPFILLTSFVVLNVFIAIIVGAMGDIRAEDKAQAVSATLAHQEGTTQELLLAEIALMREQLARLEALSTQVDTNKNSQQ